MGERTFGVKLYVLTFFTHKKWHFRSYEKILCETEESEVFKAIAKLNIDVIMVGGAHKDKIA